MKLSAAITNVGHTTQARGGGAPVSDRLIPFARLKPVGDRRSKALAARHLAAFTLAEVMAALVFMAIVIPVALEGLSIASRAGEVGVLKCEAARVAESLLNENIVTTNWDKSVQNGSLRQGLHDYRWTLRSEPWNLDMNLSYMRLLSVEVAFSAKGQDYAVRLSTLINTDTSASETNSAQ